MKVENAIGPTTSGWSLRSLWSFRGALRVLAMVCASCAVYIGLGTLFGHHNPNEISDDLVSALATFGAINIFMPVFAFCHAHVPFEAIEIDAHISGRGVLRALATITGFGCFVVAQYAAWWQHNQVCWAAAGAGFVSWVLFAIVYGVYVTNISSDRLASSKSVLRTGSGARTILKMEALFVVSLLLIGIASHNAQTFLIALACTTASLVCFAITIGSYRDNVELDYDRG
jgi:hypothetical protein